VDPEAEPDMVVRVTRQIKAIRVGERARVAICRSLQEQHRLPSGKKFPTKLHVLSDPAHFQLRRPVEAQ
jgi:hypothetical protein